MLSHPEDQTDRNLPLMIWWGTQPLIAKDTERAATLLTACKIPLVQQFIARRMATSK